MLVRSVSDTHPVELDALPHFSQGGEARLYRWPSRIGMVAKVYLRPTQQRGAKLRAMLKHLPEQPDMLRRNPTLVWPKELLVSHAQPDEVVGFLMPEVVGGRPLMEVYNPALRKRIRPRLDYRFLVRTASNLSAVMCAIHSSGYVVADLRETNVLVDSEATVSFVDVDSFQVRDGDVVFRCPVGTPDFLPPELHGCDLQRNDRTVEHDRYGLAVLMFLLLMEGVHPFDGSYLNADDTSQRWDRMRVGHFAFGGGLSILEPPPLAVPYTLLPPEIRALVSECFVAGHIDPARRPSAVRWRDALGAMDGALIQCDLNENHWFPVHLRGICPWCERRDGQDGNDPFPSSREEPAPVPRSRAEEQRPLGAQTALPAPAVSAAPPVRGAAPPNWTPLEPTVLSAPRPIRPDPRSIRPVSRRIRPVSRRIRPVSRRIRPVSRRIQLDLRRMRPGAAYAVFAVLMCVLAVILTVLGYPGTLVVGTAAAHAAVTAVLAFRRAMWRWPIWFVTLTALSATLYLGAGKLQRLKNSQPMERFFAPDFTQGQ